jgi:hypothetical protein
MLRLLVWPKKLLLSIEIGVGFNLFHNGVGKIAIEDIR